MKHNSITDVAAQFQHKLSAEKEKPGMFGRLPLAPPGRKVVEPVAAKPEPIKKSNIDYHKLKELILYSGEIPFEKAKNLQKKIELLNELSNKALSAGVKLAFKVEEVGDKGYQNTTASEEELMEALTNYLRLMTALKKVNDDILFYANTADTSTDEILTTMTENVKEFAKRG